MGLLSEEENYLTEVVADEALIRVPAEATEWESDEFLQEKKVLLLV